MDIDTAISHLKQMRDARLIQARDQDEGLQICQQTVEACGMAISALQERQRRKAAPKPLSIAELRQLDGKPVLVIVKQPVPFEPDLEMYCLVDASEPDGVILTNSLGGSDGYVSDNELAEQGMTVYPVLY